MVVSSAGTTVFTGINGAAGAPGAVGTGAGAGVGIGVVDGREIAANGGAAGVTTDVASGADIDSGGGPVGRAGGPPDIIFENAIGSIPGGICIPDISAAAMISAAVGSIVPVM